MVEILRELLSSHRNCLAGPLVLYGKPGGSSLAGVPPEGKAVWRSGSPAPVHIRHHSPPLGSRHNHINVLRAALATEIANRVALFRHEPVSPRSRARESAVSAGGTSCFIVPALSLARENTRWSSAGSIR